MKKYLEQLFSDEIPISSDFGAEIPFFTLFSNLIKYSSPGIVIYGAGRSGYYHLSLLRSMGIEPVLFVEGDITRHDTVFYGVKVVHLSHAHEYIHDPNTIAIVCSTVTEDNQIVAREIDRVLSRCGCKQIIRVSFQRQRYGNWKLDFMRNKDRFLDVFDSLEDDLSKENFVEYIRAVMQDDIYRKPAEHPDLKYWGGGGIIRFKN